MRFCFDISASVLTRCRLWRSLVVSRLLITSRPNGQIDFLEVKPAPNGAAADRFSPFANWTKGLSVAQVQARLARAARGIGQIVDLRVVSRGASHRVTDLEIVGTNGTAHVRGGRIRSALGLREQLFVIDREYDDSGTRD